VIGYQLPHQLHQNLQHPSPPTRELVEELELQVIPRLNQVLFPED
jgi:hypothetical protein